MITSYELIGGLNRLETIRRKLEKERQQYVAGTNMEMHIALALANVKNAIDDYKKRYGI